MAKLGRPKFKINYDKVEAMASVMATEEEIAAVLGCDVRTLQRDDEFCRIYKKGLKEGKMSLRRTQYELAKKSASMAIFLGKQYLGQTDKVETVVKEVPLIEEKIIDNANLSSVMANMEGGEQDGKED